MRSMDKVLRPYIEKASAIKDPNERLIFMIREFTRMICLNPDLRILIHETMSIRDQYFDEIRKPWKQHYILLRDTIQEVKSSGKLSSIVEPSRAALFLLGMMTWITFWFDYRRQEEIDSIAEAAVYQGFYGLFGSKG